MARTNVEDDWYIDKTKRRAALMRYVAALPRNIEREADGYALDAWRTAQDFWKKGELVPEDVWERAGLEPLIKAGLAERRAEGIYVKGSKDQHDWIKKKHGAAKKGGETRAAAPRDGNGRFQPSTSHSPAIHQPPAGEQLDDSAKTPAGDQASASPPAPAPALGDNSLRIIQSSNNPQAPTQDPVDNSPPHPAEAADAEAAPGSKRVLRFSERDMKLAVWMQGKVFRHSPDLPNLLRSDLENWADEIRRIQEVDQIPYATLLDVLLWTFDDPFWKARVQSPSGARNNWEKLAKGYNDSRRGFDKHSGAHSERRPSDGSGSPTNRPGEVRSVAPGVPGS